MYRINIEYGPMEPDEKGMVLSEASEECESKEDALAAVEYWLSKNDISEIHITNICEE